MMPQSFSSISTGIRGDHGFESCWSPDFFRLFLKLENLLRWSFLTFIYNHSLHMNYFIYTLHITFSRSSTITYLPFLNWPWIRRYQVDIFKEIADISKRGKLVWKKFHNLRIESFGQKLWKNIVCIISLGLHQISTGLLKFLQINESWYIKEHISKSF